MVYSLSAATQEYKENNALAMLTCSLSLFFRVEAMETVVIAIMNCARSENEMVQHVLNVALLQKQHPVFDAFSFCFPSVVVFPISVLPLTFTCDMQAFRNVYQMNCSAPVKALASGFPFFCAPNCLDFGGQSYRCRKKTLSACTPKSDEPKRMLDQITANIRMKMEKWSLLPLRPSS